MDFDYSFIEVFNRGKFLIFLLLSGIWQFRLGMGKIDNFPYR